MKRLEEKLTDTYSVCPVCLQRLDAITVQRGDAVFLRKNCPEHGEFETVIWRGAPAYTDWIRPKEPNHPPVSLTTVQRGCPYDCGLCPEHGQHTCCVLLEVTQRCNLGCPVCFAASEVGAGQDPSLAQIRHWYQILLDCGGPYNIQLSGGEPTLRDDLPEIIAMGREMGFTFFQLNTNGLRLATDPGYVKCLKDAGLSTVFLQFDGTEDQIYLKLRGRSLLAEKQRAIENCSKNQLGIVLVPTLVPGVNTQNIGAMINFALQRIPHIRGVHFQPMSYFGRYPMPPADSARITLPEVMQAIAQQTEGMIKVENLAPSAGEHALCSFHGTFIYQPEDGRLQPVTTRSSCGCGCGSANSPQAAAKAQAYVAKRWGSIADTTGQADGEEGDIWDIILKRIKTNLFSISGMAFQDAWNLDLERLRYCYVHIMSPDGKLIPFCAYNLTNCQGKRLHRERGG